MSTQTSSSGAGLHAWRERLRAIDGVIYSIERVLLFVSVVLMTVLVFANVIQRTFSRPVGKTADFLNAIIGWFTTPTAETVTLVEQTVGPALFYIAGVFFCIAATHAARGRIVEQEGLSAPPAVGKSVVVGIAIFVGAALAVAGLQWVAPAGIPGAQKFALGFLVWSGLLGASLASRARRHIVLDAVLRKLSGATALWFAFFSGAMTFLFCAILGYLSLSKAIVEISEWSASNYTIHVFESAPIPVWVVTLALPAGFIVTGLRFLFLGLQTLLFGVMPEGVDEHGVDFDALAAEAAAPTNEPAVAGVAPSVVYGRPHVATVGETP